MHNIFLRLLQNSLRKTTKISSFSFLPKALSFQSLSSYTQTPQRQSTKNRALKILSLITPKPIPNTTQHTHLRLVQQFIQTNPNNLDIESSGSVGYAQNVFDEMLIEHPYDNLTFSERLRIDPSAISNALSLCGSGRDWHCGVQYHCLSVRTGFVANVYIGSCLVSMYSKCGELSEAFRVFQEMPVRNVVSWTAMIAGFAQEWQVECCLGIYRQMRELSLRPNDFTFTSLLSCLTGSGALGYGRSCHCQVVKMGFETSVYVANALISMYCKCGVVEDALRIFRDMIRRDVVSWNSMIAGYSLHGLAEKAIGLFEEMKKRDIKPDAFTFLGVLSSCRHAGLVDEGQLYFESMMKHGVEPELDHYSCITDLLGRAGLLKEACDFIKKMPVPPNAVIWGSLLSSCRLHGNIWIGIEAAEKRLLLEPSCAATHVLLANLYGSVGYWDKAARVRKAMKHNGLRTNPGYSWIEITNEVHKFKAEDRSNIRVNEILAALDGLAGHMITLGYVPDMQEEDAGDALQ